MPRSPGAFVPHSLPFVAEDIAEVNVGDTFSYDEVWRPEPLRAAPPVERTAGHIYSLAARAPENAPRQSTHIALPSSSARARAPSAVRFRTGVVFGMARPELSTGSMGRPRTSALDSMSSVPHHALVATPDADPSFFRDEYGRPLINLLPTYPPSLLVAHPDLHTTTTPRTHAPPRPPRSPRRTPSSTSSSPSTAAYFPEHPYARNLPVSSSTNNNALPVPAHPSPVTPFPLCPPDFIQEDKPKPPSRNVKADRPPRILPRTCFKFGFLFPPLWLVGAMFLCIKPPNVTDASAFVEEGGRPSTRQSDPEILASPGRRTSGTGQDHVALLQGAERKWAHRSLAAFAVFCLLLSIALGLYLSFHVCFASC